MNKEKLITKYKRYVTNITWHINTNKPEGLFLVDCHNQLRYYNEIINDLSLLESPQPSAPYVSAEEIEKKVWGMLAILPKESKCHDELLGDCFPVHSVLKAIKLSIEYAQAQQGKWWVRVEDGLPTIDDADKLGMVLCFNEDFYKNKRTLVCIYDDMPDTVTHWMRLPLSPKK